MPVVYKCLQTIADYALKSSFLPDSRAVDNPRRVPTAGQRAGRTDPIGDLLEGAGVELDSAAERGEGEPSGEVPGDRGEEAPRVNYKLFERDLIIVSHLYAEMAGMIEAKTRNTPQLLETIVKEILNEFNNLEDFARANDTKKSSYLVKGNIKSGFGKYKAKIGITDEDFEKQFEELYKLVNPHTSETRIYYYKFSENLSKYVTPIILKVSLL
jgi:hypothetical protein